jgi:hypothetical protein
VNATSWSARASLFTFPRLTRKNPASQRIGSVHYGFLSVMYITDNTRLNGAQSANRQELTVGSSGKIVSLLSRRRPSSEGVRQRLPCAMSTLGIDPRRTDSGVGGRLVDGFARQLGGQGRAEERRQRPLCARRCLRVKLRTIYPREDAPRAKEGPR